MIKKIGKVFKGFKGFRFGGRCLGNARYEAGKTYDKKLTEEDLLKPCSAEGYHFCKKAEEVWSWYPPICGGLPSQYAEVEAPAGSFVNDPPKGGFPKVISSQIHIANRFKDIWEFARDHFRKIKARLINHGFSIYIAEPKVGFLAPDDPAVLIGSLGNQCLNARNGIGVSDRSDSAVFSTRLAVTTHDTSYSCAAAAVALYGGACGSKVAVGGVYAEARSYGAVALVLNNTGVAKGKRESLLVFYNNGQPAAFKVDGKKVKEDTLYALFRGCLCEVDPYKDMPEGSLE